MTELEFWKRLQDFLAIEDINRVKALGSKVLEMLSARLTFEEAEDVKAQLSAGLKVIWERHEREMQKWNREQFVTKVREECFLENDADAERVVRGVFGVLQEGISPGEADDVEAQLPKDMKPLWQSAGVVRETQAGEEARRIIY